MTTVRQFRALGLLVWRFGTRRSFRGGKPQVGLRAAANRLMLIGLMVASFALNFGRLAYGISQKSHGRVAATGLFLDSLFFFALVIAAGIELLPTLTRRTGALGDPGMLDPLPLRFATRLGLVIAQAGLLLAFAIPCALCLAGPRAAREWPALLALATELGLASILVGTLVCQGLRVILSAHRARQALQTLVWVSGIAATGGILLAGLPIKAAGIGAIRSELAKALPLFKPVTAVLASRPGSSYGLAGAWLGVGGGLAVALLWLIDRRGFDRVLTAPPKVLKSSRSPMNANRVERLLLRREARAVLTWITAGGGLVFSTYLSWRFLRPDQDSSSAHGFAMFLPYFVAEFGFIQAWSNAIQQASRDLRARPLLASLPLTPAATLAPKEAALWWAVLPTLSWLIPPLLATHGDGELLWKSGVVAAGVVLICLAMPALAFLSQGLGATMGTGAGARLEGLLVSLPLFGALAAPTPLTELPSLGALALIAFEARRAAALRVRWLDDGGDELERETPVWRALMVFAFFVGLQALAGLALSFAASGATLAIAYLVSATALVLLTLNGRQGIPRLLWQGARRWLIPAGLALGGAAGLLAVGYGKWIDQLGLDHESPLTLGYQDASPLVRAALSATMILAAPLAEEMFFRGWLQPAIRVELPARWKRLAFVLSAFAFASIHPGLAFPVVFLLGLVAGLLYELTGGILAGICAHAAYNAVVTFIGG